MKIGLRHIFIFAFVIIAYILLPVMNADYLFAIQENSVFISGKTFMQSVTDSPYGGWAGWLACYLTQFLYHPWIGSTMLIALWVATYYLLTSATRLKGAWNLTVAVPLLFLPINILDYGYWLYYTKTLGWAFNTTLMCLAVALCLWTTMTAARIFVRSEKAARIFSTIALTLSFLIVTLTLGPWRINDHQSELRLTMSDKNFHRELRMYRAIDESRYTDALSEAENLSSEPTNLMVLLKNTALMHEGRIADMFSTGNCGIAPNTPDDLQPRISQLAAPLVYYQFGQMNFAYRWAMENSVKYRQSFRNLKMMIRASIFNQEFDVAMKYITILKTSLFYRDWAKEREAWIMNSTRFIQHPEFAHIAPLTNDDADMLDMDEGLCEKYLIEHFSDLRKPSSPLLEDVIMCMSLWAADDYTFCVHFYDYVNRHPNDPIPELYQQGAILLGTQESSPITLNNFLFDQIVSTRYNSFVSDYNSLSSQNINQKEMGKRLKPLYGDTFWWHYYFCNYLNIY